MNFNKHYDLEGKHAFLGASNPSWLNYDADRLIFVYDAMKAKERGTELHDLAARLIKIGQKLPRSKKTLNMYVNDAIGFHMQPEVLLYYSNNCFGTADTICFDGKLLRIHDYKSGSGKTHMEQLYIYAALFCLEYRVDPRTIDIITAIYQNDDIRVEPPTGELIKSIMDKIIKFDKELNKHKEE